MSNPNNVPYQPAPQQSQPQPQQPQQPSQEAPYGQPAGQTDPYGQPAGRTNPYESSPYGGDPYGSTPPYNGQYGNPYASAPYTGNPYGGAPNAAPPLDRPYYGCLPQEAFLRFFKKYATFSGRASRSEYWWWTLISFVIMAVLQLLANVTDDKLEFLLSLWQLGTLVPNLAISVRRLHDSNRSGGWIALPIGLSFAGSILMIAGLAGGMFGAIASLGAGHREAITTLGASGAVFIIGALMVVAGVVVDIVFMVASSRPEGAQYDHEPGRYGMPVDAYGNPYGGAPYDGDNGNPAGGPAPINPPVNGPHGR